MGTPRDATNAAPTANSSSCGMPFARRGLVFEPPRITVLLKLVNDVISNAKPLCLIEFMPQAANQLTGAPQREGHSKPEHVPACSHGKACLEQKENDIKEDANSPVNYADFAYCIKSKWWVCPDRRSVLRLSSRTDHPGGGRAPNSWCVLSSRVCRVWRGPALLMLIGRQEFTQAKFLAVQSRLTSR
jgi:hypothetical protein